MDGYNNNTCRCTNESNQGAKYTGPTNNKNSYGGHIRNNSGGHNDVKVHFAGIQKSWECRPVALEGGTEKTVIPEQKSGNISDFKDNTHIEIIKNILQKMEFNFSNKALNILSHRNPKNNSYEKNQIQLHFDEKWIFNDYIKKFVNIEPAENELINFIKEIVKKKEKKLIITTGINLPNKMNKIENELNELNISLHKNLDFLELEKITSQSKVLISCHGAISHVAAAYNIKQIDIIDKTYDYSRWTNHFRNYNYLYRDNFSKLSCRILDLI